MRPIAGLSLLFLLLLPLFAITRQWLTVPDMLIGHLDWLPYALVTIGLFLCLVFYNSREFCLLLLAGGFFWLLQGYVWSKGLPGVMKQGLFDLLSILLPLNLLVLYFLKERGLLNRHGGKRLALIVAELMLLFWLVHTHRLELLSWLAIEPLNTDLTRFTVIKQAVLALWLAAFMTLLINWSMKAGFMRAIWLLTLLALMITMHAVQHVLISTLYFVFASLVIIAGIMINAYHLAYRDELTLLPSRRALKQQLLALGKNYAIAMVDVDHFKKLNDTYGHDVGDDVLKLLASQLRTVEGGGKAFRYGGEEFTVVFPGRDSAHAADYLDLLRRRIAATPFILRHKKRPRRKPQQKKPRSATREINITVSIGVAEKQDRHGNPQEVIKTADKALYKAKEGGRNQVVVG